MGCGCSKVRKATESLVGSVTSGGSAASRTSTAKVKKERPPRVQTRARFMVTPPSGSSDEPQVLSTLQEARVFTASHPGWNMEVVREPKV